jgi:hypothetical protein
MSKSGPTVAAPCDRVGGRGRQEEEPELRGAARQAAKPRAAQGEKIKRKLQQARVRRPARCASVS